MNELNEYEFIESYMVILEDLQNSIKDHLGLEFNDHALVRLCANLEEELKLGENRYE